MFVLGNKRLFIEFMDYAAFTAEFIATAVCFSCLPGKPRFFFRIFEVLTA